MAPRPVRPDPPRSVSAVPEGPRPVAASTPPRPASAPVLASERATEAMGTVVDPTPEGRRERHRRETFERLVKAAREIMFSRGFNDITVQDITDAADVGKGTFFNYFRSKEHVVSRVHEYNRRSVNIAVEQLRTAQASVPDALASILMSLLCPAGGEWLTYQTNTMRALALNTEVRGLVSQEMTKTRQGHETLVSLGQGQGAIRVDVPAADLAMVQQTFFAGLTVLLWIHNTMPTPELVNEVTRNFYALLQPPPSPAPAPHPTDRAVKAKPTRSSRRSRSEPSRPGRTARRSKPAKARGGKR